MFAYTPITQTTIENKSSAGSAFVRMCFVSRWYSTVAVRRVLTRHLHQNCAEFCLRYMHFVLIYSLIIVSIIVYLTICRFDKFSFQKIFYWYLIGKAELESISAFYDCVFICDFLYLLTFVYFIYTNTVSLVLFFVLCACVGRGRGRKKTYYTGL